jgi:hypothetical protein
MSTDSDWDKEKAERDRIETSKEKSIEERNWLWTWLVGAAAVAASCFAVLCVVLVYVVIYYGVPAVKDWSAASRASADGVPTIVRGFDQTIAGLNDEKNGLPAMLQAGRDTLLQVKDTVKTQNGTLSDVGRGLVGAVGQLQSTTKQIGDRADTVVQHGGEQASILAASATKAIDELPPTTTRLRRAIDNTTDSLNLSTTLPDGTVQPGLLPATVRAINGVNTLVSKTGMTADEATSMIKQLSEKSGKTQDEINAWIVDPRNGQILDNIVKTTGYMAKTGKAISDFSRITIISTILSRLLAAIVPGVL